MWINFALILKDALYLSVIALLSYLFYKERKELLNRIMADTYKEYEYFQNMYKKDIKETEKIRNDTRKTDAIDEEIKKEQDAEYKEEKKFIEGVGSDWDVEEVDLPELRRRRNEPK